MQAGHVGLVGDLFPFLAHDLLQLEARLGDDLLDAGGVDAPVLHQLVQRAAGDLAAHGIEGGDGDRLRRVVDDQVDAGRLLQRPDVAALAADDAALHVVRGQGNDGDGRLRHVVGGDALDGGGQYPARAAVGFFVDLKVDLVQAASGHGPRLVLDLPHQLVFGLIGGEAGDPLQLLQVTAARRIELGHLPRPLDLELGLPLRLLRLPGLARLLRFLVESAQLLLSPIEAYGLLVDRLLFLLDAALDAFDFLAPLGKLAVEVRAEADSLVLRLESSIASSGFSFLQDTVGVRLHLAGVGFGAAFQVPPGREEGGNDDERGLEDAEDDVLGVHRHP